MIHPWKQILEEIRFTDLISQHIAEKEVETFGLEGFVVIKRTGREMEALLHQRAVAVARRGRERRPPWWRGEPQPGASCRCWTVAGRNARGGDAVGAGWVASSSAMRRS